MSLPIANSGIAAEAFGLCELDPISSFADASPQAEDAVRYFAPALRQCLELFDASFASRLVQLPPAALPAGHAPDPELPCCYLLPGDCVMLREVRPRGSGYRLDDGFLLRSDQAGGLVIRYTRMIADESKVSEQFRHACALALALRLAPRWLGHQEKRRDLERRWKEVSKAAMRPDARTASAPDWDGAPSPDWVELALR